MYQLVHCDAPPPSPTAGAAPTILTIVPPVSRDAERTRAELLAVATEVFAEEGYSGARVDDIAEFTELGDFLRMPLRTYSTGMRVRLALGVVTSIDPEILLLDEGIGAVDAAFLEKSKKRLGELVQRSGLLVFASHSDEFLVELCDTAIWMDGGVIREQGSLRDVVSHYKGRDVFENLSPETLERLERTSTG